ncbi:hypothetical protein JCM8097_000560 [Rhodosporidiobolus ruineniae]
MAAPAASSPAPKRTTDKLSQRPFKAQLPPADDAPSSSSSSSSKTSAPVASRALKRVHLAPEIMAAVKVGALDVMVVRRHADADKEKELADGVGKLELDEGEASQLPTRAGFAVGVAWPSYKLGGYAVGISPLMLANAGLSVGETASVSTLENSGVELLDAKEVVLIYDGKGKAVKEDSFFEAYARETLKDVKFVAVNHFIELQFNGVLRRCVVASAKSASPVPTASSPSPSSTFDFTFPPREQVFVVSSATEVLFKPPQTVAAPKSRSKASTAKGEKGKPPFGPQGELPGYESIGGMESQIEQIREMVEWPLTRPELYSHFGLRPPRGILLYGPPGTGKTLLASAIAKSTRSSLFVINGPSLSSAYHGETEDNLRKIFAQAKAASPSIVVIDEVDALAPNREEGGEVERRVVAQLLTLMDGLEDKDDPEEDEGDEGEEGGEKKEKAQPRVVVIAATNRPNAIDPALRRPGRFDKELEIGVPDASARLSILKVMLRKTPHDIFEDALVSVAGRTHGFVGADLSSLVHTAGLLAIKRVFSSPSSTSVSSSASTPPLSSQKLLPSDLESALLSTRPSAMREVFLETPKVLFSDIGGQEAIKAKLRQSVDWPLRHPEAFKRLGVKPPRGVLLYGPPGCSKTLIAKALATESGLNFIAVKGPELFNKYVGESERAIREIFRKARAAAPSIVFLDEVDSLAPERGSDDSGGASGDRVLMSLLTEMDGIEELNGVIVLAATNRPDVIDPALMRPGRLDRILYVSPPDREARKQIFRIQFGKMAVAEDVDVEELAELTEGCSGAEVVSICQDAALAAMEADINSPTVGREFFVFAAKTVRRRITPEVVAEYEEWRDRSGVRSA